MDHRVRGPRCRERAEGGLGSRADEVGVALRGQRDDNRDSRRHRLSGPAVVTNQQFPGGLDAVPPASEFAPLLGRLTSAACTGRDTGSHVSSRTSHRSPPATPRTTGVPRQWRDRIGWSRRPAREGAGPPRSRRRPAGPRRSAAGSMVPGRERSSSRDRAAGPGPRAPGRRVRKRFPLAGRGCGCGIGEIGEVHCRPLFEVQQAVMSPSAQMRQVEQPRADARIRGLDPGQHLITGPEGRRFWSRGIRVAGGSGDGMQQHGVLTALSLP